VVVPVGVGQVVANAVGEAVAVAVGDVVVVALGDTGGEAVAALGEAFDGTEVSPLTETSSNAAAAEEVSSPIRPDVSVVAPLPTST
jgi:hypothetical protein